MNYPWQNVLYIDSHGKTIPYHYQPKDGEVGTGFINLKRQSVANAGIPEAQEDGGLLSVLESINQADTGVFSVGCDLTKIVDNNGYKFSAYIEFAVNDRALVCDPHEYFALFFTFYNQLAQVKFAHDVRFDWVIIPAVFTETGTSGFTCSIKINCPYYPGQVQANAVWSDAITQLTSLLTGIPDTRGEHIY